MGSMREARDAAAAEARGNLRPTNDPLGLRRASRLARIVGLLAASSIATIVLAGGALVPTTLTDFHLPGTQIGDVPLSAIRPSDNCTACHGGFSVNDPVTTWQTSLMAHAGRDPLFFAQMTNANQDVANVGYFCMRCHVPMSFVTGHAYDVDGSTLDALDKDGVSCHFCHSLVDPVYKPGASPPRDESILAAMPEVPSHYGNAMFVVDPSGSRRGPYSDAASPHESVPSPFHRTGEFCGTCHDVGNVQVTRSPEGTYRYNALDTEVPDSDLHTQFPLERTYTEWKLSSFANGGVDMGGLYGTHGSTVVSTCQDCHMPRVRDKGCVFGPERDDLARHEFAGAAAFIFEIIAVLYEGDPNVSRRALRTGRLNATTMLRRAVNLGLRQAGGQLGVRVINQTGHKLPTGHIEGRRVWVNVKFFDAAGALLAEHGRYDRAEAELDEASTTVYEMKIGLSAEAAAATGLPAGETMRMALADTIVKDNRIPPRGFVNSAFEAAGAPVVGAAYADGQHWDDLLFPIPAGAARAEASVFYQVVTRHYIEGLRDGNVTNGWGRLLYDLWIARNKAKPIKLKSKSIDLLP